MFQEGGGMEEVVYQAAIEMCSTYRRRVISEEEEFTLVRTSQTTASKLSNLQLRIIKCLLASPVD